MTAIIEIFSFLSVCLFIYFICLSVIMHSRLPPLWSLSCTRSANKSLKQRDVRPALHPLLRLFHRDRESFGTPHVIGRREEQAAGDPL